MFAEEVNKIKFSANDGKRIQPIDFIETNTYETSKDLACKEETKCNNAINQYQND